jgi:hypothetical protein
VIKLHIAFAHLSRLLSTTVKARFESISGRQRCTIRAVIPFTYSVEYHVNSYIICANEYPRAPVINSTQDPQVLTNCETDYVTNKQLVGVTCWCHLYYAYLCNLHMCGSVLRQLRSQPLEVHYSSDVLGKNMERRCFF